MNIASYNAVVTSMQIRRALAPVALVIALLAPGAAAAFGGDRVYVHRIDNHEQFVRFSVPLDDVPFTKFVIDTKTMKPYYFWTAVYPFHYHFVNEVLRKGRPDAYADIHAFNRSNHEGIDREYLLGSIAFHPGRKVYTFEFLQADHPTAEIVQDTYKVLHSSFYDDGLLWRPVGKGHLAIKDKVKGVPVVGPGMLETGGDYQFLNAGKAVGRLRVVPETADATQMDFDRDEIVVLHEVPMDIQPVAGVISLQFSTPLSHVALRARAWGIPNIGLKDALKQTQGLVGGWVYLEARQDGCEVRKATDAEVTQAKQNQRQSKHPVYVPTVDLDRRGLPTLAEINTRDIESVGAKAANLGTLYRNKNVRWDVPPGFVVPFAHYADFMRNNRLDDKVGKFLSDPVLKKDKAARRKALDALRAAIKAGKHTPSLAKAITAKLREPAYLGKGVFVRSSTNAEDLDGFNGAGLYDTVPNVKGDDKVLDAIKQVWSSLWNVRAYEERAFYRIDHASCFPAVLLQVGVNATGAGVMITTNIYDPTDDRSVTINAKHGLGLRVVDGKKVPEQVLYDRTAKTMRIISRSDDDVALVFDKDGGVKEVKTGGKPVLTEKLVQMLAASATDVERIFPGKGPQDIEWLIVDGGVHLVQSRPYVGPGAQ